MTDHPITPTPELVRKWLSEYFGHPVNGEISSSELDLATQAARWGSDQELEACINEIYKGVGLRHVDYSSNRELLCSDLRAARRPKPLSLKEQALQAMCRFMDSEGHDGLTPEEVSEDFCLIRRALESLPD